MPEINLNKPIFDEQARNSLPQSMTPEKPGGPKRPPIDWSKRAALGFFILFLFTAGMVSIVFLRNKKPPTPTSDNVSINIQGPDNLAAGNEVQYVFIYQNGENADLLNVSMDVFYPSNFKFTSSEPKSNTSSGQSFNLPVLKQGQQGEVTVRGKLNGKVGETKEVRARLNYTLSNFNSQFTVEDNFTTTMLAPKLTLEITGPIDVTNGQNTTYAVNYANVSDQEYDNVVIKMTYPPGFKFAAGNPPASKDGEIWNIGKLPLGGKGKIDVSGSFTGDPMQEKLVIAELGTNINNSFAPQITASVAFKVVPSKLNLTQKSTPADSVHLGETINYILSAGNFGTIAMSNVVITLKLEGAAVDFGTLKANDGIITGNTVTWKSGTRKELALLNPNQTDTITLSVPLKNSLSSNIKNQVVKGIATIYSDQVTNPIRSQDLEIKLSSELGMLVSGKYVSGAMPMKVGQATTFAVTILLTNFSNDLEDVQVIASLPLPASSWKNIIIPESERANVVFDVNANKIRWKPGKLAAFVGKFSPARTMTFHLEVTPGEGNKGAAMSLLKDIQATALDTFINKDLESPKVNDYRTTDIDDPIVEDQDGGSVRP